MSDQRTEEERLDDEAAPWHVLHCTTIEGTVAVFRCEDPTGAEHLVAVDHRLAHDILDGLAAPTGEDGVYIERPAAWQVLAHIHQP